MLEETQHEVYLYRDNFLQFNEKEQLLTIELEHYHWLGVMNLPPAKDDGSGGKREKRQEPIAITISQQVRRIRVRLCRARTDALARR